MPLSAGRHAAVFAAPLAGVAGGLAASVVFATAHALLIVPIWNRAGGGVVFALIAGAVAGWAFERVHPGVVWLRPAAAISLGAQYGALLWLAVAPVTLADMVLRVMGMASRHVLRAVEIAVLLAVGGGLLLGRRVGGTRRAAIAAAATTLLLTFAMAGPVPIIRSGRALAIWLAVLPSCVAGGVVTALIASRQRTRELGPPPSSQLEP